MVYYKFQMKVNDKKQIYFVVGLVAATTLLILVMVYYTTRTTNEVIESGQALAPIEETNSTTTIESEVIDAEEADESSETLQETSTIKEMVSPAISEEANQTEVEQFPESVEMVTVAHRNVLLAGHNTTRSAKGLSPLAWSSLVAQSAQAWADTLSGRGCQLQHSDTPYGENLYYSWSTGPLVLNPAEAVSWWVAEEQHYNYPNNSCAAGEQCGHYTQMVWAETTRVGCGVSTCTDGGRNTQMWVCQYDPAGNVGGGRPY